MHVVIHAHCSWSNVTYITILSPGMLEDLQLYKFIIISIVLRVWSWFCQLLWKRVLSALRNSCESMNGENLKRCTDLAGLNIGEVLITFLKQSNESHAECTISFPWTWRNIRYQLCVGNLHDMLLIPSVYP